MTTSTPWMSPSTSNPEQTPWMWNSLANPGLPAPGMGGPISGCDPHLQQAHQQQAQSQAQINLLQQPNAFLNQQFASQVASHIQHLQQSILPKQPSPAFQTPDQPQLLLLHHQKAPPKEVKPTVPTFNPDEMVKKLKRGHPQHGSSSPHPTGSRSHQSTTNCQSTDSISNSATNSASTSAMPQYGLNSNHNLFNLHLAFLHNDLLFLHSLIPLHLHLQSQFALRYLDRRQSTTPASTRHH